MTATAPAAVDYDNMTSRPFPPLGTRSSGGWGGGNGSRAAVGDVDRLPPDLDSDMKVIFVCAYTVIMLLAVVGNGLMVTTVTLSRKLRTVTNTFIVSLAVSDTLIAVVNMPVQLMYHVQNEWTLGEIVCKVSRYAQGVVIVNSILTLTGMAVDR